MKIDSDLRLAIRASERCQPTSTWEQKNKDRQAAIKKVVGNPKHAPKIKAAKARIKRLNAAIARAESVMHELGLTADLDRIRDDALFYKAGGRIIPSLPKWTYDAVMKELAEATPAEGAKILKRLKIRWD